MEDVWAPLVPAPSPDGIRRFEEAREAARSLRQRGKSFEEIAEEISGDGYTFTPHWVYSVVTGKKGKQVAEWRRKQEAGQS